jgi:hypothetical protein
MLRLLIFLAVQGVFAGPAFIARTRFYRGLWVGGLFVANLVFAMISTGPVVRAQVDTIVVAEHDGTLSNRDHLVNNLVSIARRGAALQASLTFWFAVLAIVPLRRVDGQKMPRNV